MLAQAEREAEVDGINELGLLQNQVTAPDNWPKVVLNYFGQQAMRRRQCADPDGCSTLFSLWNCMEELSEIVHRGRKHHLIIRTAGQLKDWYSDEVTDDLGINSDDMPVNSGLKYQPTVTILHHL
jgi:hypothetical protein